MKKLILAIAFLGFGVAISNAQAPAAAPAQDKKQSTTAKPMAPKSDAAKTDAVKAAAPKADAKKADAKSSVEKKSAPDGAMMKKDGTPDKRFKANKEAKGPLKKDGTPDKRFKENKDAKPATK